MKDLEFVQLLGDVKYLR